MIYWIWFAANALISLLFVVRVWPASVYATSIGNSGDFVILFGFLPAWFILTFSTLAALVLMYVPKRRNRGILYVVLFIASYLLALHIQHTVLAPIACMPYAVIALGIFLVSRTIYINSELYDPHR